jgi:hypothetical protein
MKAYVVDKIPSVLILLMVWVYVIHIGLNISLEQIVAHPYTNLIYWPAMDLYNLWRTQ